MQDTVLVMVYHGRRLPVVTGLVHIRLEALAPPAPSICTYRTRLQKMCIIFQRYIVLSVSKYDTYNTRLMLCISLHAVWGLGTRWGKRKAGVYRITRES